jgi:hypothetical protein
MQRTMGARGRLLALRGTVLTNPGVRRDWASRGARSQPKPHERWKRDREQATPLLRSSHRPCRGIWRWQGSQPAMTEFLTIDVQFKLWVVQVGPGGRWRQ